MRSIRRRLFWIGVICLLLILATAGLICRPGGRRSDQTGRPDHRDKTEEKTMKAMLAPIVLVPIALVLLAVPAALALAAQGPPPPKAVNAHPVTVVARDVPTPTSFAFGAGQAFVAGFGDEQHLKVKGGVYVLEQGRAVRVPGSPAHVVGLAYRRGTLYVSDCGCGAPSRILAWSGWDGHRFASSRVVVTGPKNFTGFNGIAVGADGKLYAGISVGDKKTDDYTQGTTRYANSVVSIDPGTGKIIPLATGMRQPWQPVFVPGHSGPLVADLGQENLGKKRPLDRIVEIRKGADFGFPVCPAHPAGCSKYDEPFATFPAHSSPMGLAAIRDKLYVALFNGVGKGPEVVAMPLAGGKYSPALVGFAAPVVAIGARGGRLYAGDLTGTIYSVTP
jgi:glucose/arabinose dehydrogenase